MTKTVVAKPADLLTMVGRTLGPSEPLTITQARIDQFAEATGDHQWIHVDPEKAANGPFWKNHCPRLLNPVTRQLLSA